MDGLKKFRVLRFERMGWVLKGEKGMQFRLDGRGKFALGKL